MFLDEVILEDVSLRVNRGEKAALVGRNGCGKTTLLKIITGEMESDSGIVRLASGSKIGLLKQNQSIPNGSTVIAEAELAAHERVKLRDRLAELEKVIEAGADADAVEEYGTLQEHFHEADGWQLDSDIQSVLGRMGFEPHEYTKSTDDLSGGERTRLALAKLLLEEPDLLILDEPTNHLDLQAVEWLEGWLKRASCAVLLVSHDEVFLEATAETVIEIRDYTAKSYPGNWKQYLKLKKEADERQAKTAIQQEEEIARLDAFVTKFIDSQRTAQARGRRKLMNRLIESKVDAPTREKGMTAGFTNVTRSGDIVVEAKKLNAGYPDLTLIEELDWTVRWGDRWGVIGENGSGKSTLLKTIFGEIPPLSGICKTGTRLNIGFFTQDAVDLDPSMSPLEHILAATGIDTGPARNLLGKFLLSGDDVMRPIGKLSGGERNKVVLAELTQLSPNLLVLDEPTNHLDMDSRRALLDVLDDYPGTLILVSHDRRMLERSTSQILELRRGGHTVYPAGYADFRRKHAGEAEPDKKTRSSEPVKPKMSQRELSKEIARAQSAITEIESSIHRVETGITDVEAKLAASGPIDEVVRLSHRHTDLQSDLEDLMLRWEQESHNLEDLMSMQGG